MFARLVTRRLLQQIKVPFASRNFSSNWYSPWRKSPLILTSLAVTITGTFLYAKKRYKRSNEIYCAEERKSLTKKFEGKTVLITGAAGDLGSATARAFSEQGARIILCDLPATEPKLKQLTTELLTLGSPSVIYASLDVTNIEDVKNCVEMTVKEFGGIDVLFNNAGICCDVDPVQSTDEEVFKRTQEVNVYGVFLMMKYVANKMIESGKGGVIINMSSVAGLKGGQFSFSYGASKFAVTGMTRSAAASLAKHNIRVNALAPYFIEGSMTDRILRDVTEKGIEFHVKL